MKNVLWLMVIMLYLLTLLTYVVIDYVFFPKDEKISSVDAVFFGVASVITISIIPLLR